MKNRTNILDSSKEVLDYAQRFLYIGEYTVVKHCRVSDNILRVEGVSNSIMPLVRFCSTQFPDQEIEVRYASEELGVDVGHYRVFNGFITYEFKEETASLDFKKDFACDLLFGHYYEAEKALRKAESIAWSVKLDKGIK